MDQDHSTAQSQPRGIIVMGVSGCGKSSVGSLLAAKLGGNFFDGDDFHPPENIAKMASGQPLNDTDRQSWLESLRDLVSQQLAEGSTVVVACSALKLSYRELLRQADPMLSFIHLHGSRDLLLERLNRRADDAEHFMPVSLLDSQLNTLESPAGEAYVTTLDIDPPLETLTDQAHQASLTH